MPGWPLFPISLLMQGSFPEYTAGVTGGGSLKFQRNRKLTSARAMPRALQAIIEPDNLNLALPSATIRELTTMQILRVILIIAVALVSSRGIAINRSTERWLAYRWRSVSRGCRRQRAAYDSAGSTLSPTCMVNRCQPGARAEFELVTPRRRVPAVTETTVWVKLALELIRTVAAEVIGGDYASADWLDGTRYRCP